MSLETEKVTQKVSVQIADHSVIVTYPDITFLWSKQAYHTPRSSKIKLNLKLFRNR